MPRLRPLRRPRADRAPIERRRRLSQAALAVTNQKVRRAYSPIVIAGAVRVADFVLLSLVGIALYLGYVAPLAGFHWEYIAAIFGMTATAVICFQAADIYEVQVFRGQLRQMTRMISSWAFVFLLFIGASFFAKLGGEVSRLWLSAFFFVGLAALIAERLFLRSMVRSWARQGRLDRRTIIVGSDQNGEQLVEALKAQDDSDIDILGVFDDRNDSRALETCAGSPKLGKVDDIVEFARRTRVDLVLFALPISAETRILEMLKKLWVLPVDIRLSAHTNKLRFRPRSYSYLGKVPTLDVFEAPITDWDLVMKWLFDHVVGAIILLLALPVMALVALAIKLDSPGPVLFRQKRFGFNNERIDVFKFRSLYHRSGRSDGRQGRDQERSAASPGSAASSARPASTNCRSSSTSCSRAICRWSARARTPCRANCRAGCSTRRWTDISRVTASSPASPAGRRSTAGAAKSTAKRRSRSASSSISITSRTGRCCSTSTFFSRRRWR